jgi:hypothetical protein
VKEPEKPSTPSIEALIKFVESLRIREEIERKEIKTSKPTRKMWQKKVSSPMTSPSGDNNRTQGMESPDQDSKPELPP